MTQNSILKNCLVTSAIMLFGTRKQRNMNQKNKVKIRGVKQFNLCGEVLNFGKKIMSGGTEKKICLLGTSNSFKLLGSITKFLYKIKKFPTVASKFNTLS